MDNRTEVRDFLLTRRAKVSPARAGLPDGGQRRVPGLRRGEVAAPPLDRRAVTVAATADGVGPRGGAGRSGSDGRVRVRRRTTALGVLLSCLVVAACGGTTPAQGASSPSSPTSTGARTTTPAAVPSQPPADGDAVEGTVVRFSGGGTSVDVTMGPDTPTTRDFVSLLPFTMQLEDLGGREKIGDPPRELDVSGTPGSDPEDGDLIYFTPWGNLGFYYDAGGIEHSDATPHLGTYRASEDELSRLEGVPVTVEVVG